MGNQPGDRKPLRPKPLVPQTKLRLLNHIRFWLVSSKPELTPHRVGSKCTKRRVGRCASQKSCVGSGRWRLIAPRWRIDGGSCAVCSHANCGPSTGRCHVQKRYGDSQQHNDSTPPIVYTNILLF